MGCLSWKASVRTFKKWWSEIQGDSVKLDIWRDKQPMTVKIEFLRRRGPFLIQGHSYDVRPRLCALRRPAFSATKPGLMEAYRPTDLRLVISSNTHLEQLYLQHPDVIVWLNFVRTRINTYLAPTGGAICGRKFTARKFGPSWAARTFAETPERLSSDDWRWPPLGGSIVTKWKLRPRIKTRYNWCESKISKRNPRRTRGASEEHLMAKTICSLLWRWFSVTVTGH